MITREQIEELRMACAGKPAPSLEEAQAIQALLDARQEIDEAWGALGTTEAECADDPDVCKLADSISVGLTYERDRFEQINEMLAAERPRDVTLPFTFMDFDPLPCLFSVAVGPGINGEGKSARLVIFKGAERLGDFEFDRAQTTRLREALRLALEQIEEPFSIDALREAVRRLVAAEKTHVDAMRSALQSAVKDEATRSTLLHSPDWVGPFWLPGSSPTSIAHDEAIAELKNRLVGAPIDSADPWVVAARDYLTERKEPIHGYHPDNIEEVARSKARMRRHKAVRERLRKLVSSC